MKNKNIISPVGLKGNQINERMKELMGIKTINESTRNLHELADRSAWRD